MREVFSFLINKYKQLYEMSLCKLNNFFKTLDCLLKDIT